MKKTILHTLKLFLLLSALASSVSAQQTRQLDVLAIHSYHQEYEWTSSQYEAFKKHLKINLPEFNLNFSTEYLDTKHIQPSEKYQTKFISFLKTKYKNHIPDLVYVTDDNALKFVDLMKVNLPWDIPIIYSGINNTKISHRGDKHPIFGVFEFKDISASIRLAKKIDPTAQRVIFLGDGGVTDKAIKEKIISNGYGKPEFEIINISGAKLNKLIQQLNAVEQGVVILTSIGRVHDNYENLLDLEEIIAALTLTGRKILVMEDAYMFNGVLGGYITSGQSQGMSAAKIAAQVIRGENKTKIKNESQVSSEFILSWPDMQRFGLSVSNEKFSDATIINLPPPWLEQYPSLVTWLLWIVLLLFIVLAGFILKTKQKSELLLEQYADKVTGLPNRVRLLADINAAISPCLIIIDINNFKSINNLYGLRVGDNLLKSFAVKMRDLINNAYQVYRVGGNQFGILSKGSLSEQPFDNYITHFLKDIQHNHYFIDDIDISLTLTAGISKNERELLIPRAEQALQRAKETNKALCVIDNVEEERDQHQKNLVWAQKVNSALTSDRIIPYFQSITHNKTGKKNKFEALVRLVEEDGSVVAPFFFLEAAKSTRQYAALTKVMIEKTFNAISNEEASISINFTVDDIRNEKTIAFFKSKLFEYEVADKVIVELIESEGIENYAEVSEFITDIKKLGCRVAIDDFGTGYSNFMHLIHLNVDYLKIDGSIIQNIVKDTNAEIVAKTIVEFAGQLGIETIAEFVDSQEILDKVCDIGIDYSQGYFLGKPESKLSI